MIFEIPHSQVPDHIKTSARYIEFCQLYPESTHFMVNGLCYTPSIDSNQDITKILNFDFIYGLSYDYKVSFLVNTYKYYLTAFEPFHIPNFNSWLGTQLQALFIYNKIDIWIECARNHYDELLDALEYMFESPLKCGNNETILVYTIESNNINMFRRCIYKYGLYERIDHVHYYMPQITQLNRVEMFKIYADYAIEKQLPLKFLYQSSKSIQHLKCEMLHYVYSHMNLTGLNFIYDYNTDIEVIRYLHTRISKPIHAKTIFINALKTWATTVDIVNELMELLEQNIASLLNHSEIINIFNNIIRNDNRELMNLLFKAGFTISDTMYASYLNLIKGKRYINITPAYIRMHCNRNQIVNSTEINRFIQEFESMAM